MKFHEIMLTMFLQNMEACLIIIFHKRLLKDFFVEN